MRTNVYIDGFNLYCRLLKDNPQIKWSDLKALAAGRLQPQNQIQTMRGGILPQFSLPYPVVAKVWKTEEKGSDVNLASQLIRDACQGNFDVAAVLSNDTDLVEPIRIVTQERGLRVGLLCPVPKPAAGLVQGASFLGTFAINICRDHSFRIAFRALS